MDADPVWKGDGMALTVGVDVGGTKIAGGVVTDSGFVVERTRRPTPADDPVALRRGIADVVNDLRTRHEVSAVGISAAGFVRADRRRMWFAPNVAWGDGPLADLLEKQVGCPVVVENDANAAAWAEYRFGAGVGVPDQLMVTLGTGVGGGVIVGGSIYRGAHGVAAEIGHIGLVRDGIRCACGRSGCLEQYASGRALERDAQLAAEAGRAPSLLAAAGGDPTSVTGTMVTQLAQEGEEDAVELMTQLAHYLATGISSLVAVLDPALVLIGGGLSDAGDVLLEPTRTALADDLTGGDDRPGPDLRIAALGNDAGLIGVADLARDVQ